MVGKLPVEQVAGKVDLADRAGGAVGAGEAATITCKGIAVLDLGDKLCAEVDCGNSLAGECCQFICLGDPVLVEITPDLQLGEGIVGGVDLPSWFESRSARAATPLVAVLSFCRSV